MAKAFVNAFFFLSRRASSSTAAAENQNVRLTAAAATKVLVDSGKESSATILKEVFWMRDPKTGNWIPETHFSGVDVAELREKFIGKKTKF